MELGNFPAKPLSFQFGASSKGTECVALTFRFTEGPNAGKTMTGTFYFSEKTAKRTLDSLEHCGWDGDMGTLAELKGFGSKDVELVIGEEQGNDGVMYPRISWVNKLGARGPKEVYSSEQVGSLATRLAAVNKERLADKLESTPDPFGNG
jgi:hypothetical protein